MRKIDIDLITELAKISKTFAVKNRAYAGAAFFRDIEKGKFLETATKTVMKMKSIFEKIICEENSEEKNIISDLFEKSENIIFVQRNRQKIIDDLLNEDLPQ